LVGSCCAISIKGRISSGKTLLKRKKKLFEELVARWMRVKELGIGVTAVRK
jgi:hypothetical protein